jgi:hypothetical protein
MASELHLLPKAGASGNEKLPCQQAFPMPALETKRRWSSPWRTPTPLFCRLNASHSDPQSTTNNFCQYIYLVAECKTFFDGWILGNNALKELFAKTDF